MDSQTLAFLSGLSPNWENTFQSLSPLSISLQLTDTWNPTRQLGTDRTTAETVGLMASHALRAASSPEVLRACQLSGATDTLLIQRKLECIFQFIKRRVKFVEDNEPLGCMFGIADSKELLITPPALLSMKNPKGDCDDFSMLAASMMIACGVSCSFVTVAADARAPEQFTHVYCMGAGIPFDASHGKEVGWETGQQFRKQIWPIFTGGREGEGIGMIVGTKDYKEAWLNAGLRGLLGLDDEGNYVPDGTDVLGGAAPDFIFNPIASTVPVSSLPINSSVPAINWNNLLPGIFSSAEKIAQQTTQPAGYQITGPNGQMTSVVLPQGGSLPTSIPGLSSSSLSSMLPLLLIGGVALLIFGNK